MITSLQELYDNTKHSILLKLTISYFVKNNYNVFIECPLGGTDNKKITKEIFNIIYKKYDYGYFTRYNILGLIAEQRSSKLAKTI